MIPHNRLLRMVLSLTLSLTMLISVTSMAFAQGQTVVKVDIQKGATVYYSAPTGFGPPTTDQKIFTTITDVMSGVDAIQYSNGWWTVRLLADDGKSYGYWVYDPNGTYIKSSGQGAPQAGGSNPSSSTGGTQGGGLPAGGGLPGYGLNLTNIGQPLNAGQALQLLIIGAFIYVIIIAFGVYEAISEHRKGALTNGMIWGILLVAAMLVNKFLVKGVDCPATEGFCTPADPFAWVVTIASVAFALIMLITFWTGLGEIAITTNDALRASGPSDEDVIKALIKEGADSDTISTMPAEHGPGVSGYARKLKVLAKRDGTLLVVVGVTLYALAKFTGVAIFLQTTYPAGFAGFQRFVAGDLVGLAVIAFGFYEALREYGKGFGQKLIVYIALAFVWQLFWFRGLGLVIPQLLVWSWGGAIGGGKREKMVDGLADLLILGLLVGFVSVQLGATWLLSPYGMLTYEPTNIIILSQLHDALHAIFGPQQQYSMLLPILRMAVLRV